MGVVGRHGHADRRDPRPVGQPGDRVHRLGRARRAGSRGPGQLPAHGEPARPRRRPRRPLAVRLRLLDDLRRLRRQRGSVFRAHARARAAQPRVDADARRRGADARAGRDGRGSRVLVHRRERSPVAARPAQPPGLVHQVPAQRRPGRRRGRVGRRPRAAVPDRRRSQPAARLQPVARRRRRGGSQQQSECRRQRPRGQRHLVDRPRRRADRIGPGPRADRHQRAGRRAGVRAPGRAGPRRRRVPRGVAGEGARRGGRRRDRHAQRRQRAAGDRRRQGAHRRDRPRPAGRRAHRAVLRPLDADLAGGGHAAHHALRGDRCS